ncbi:hypothetical protein [Bartonella bovis]|uniref:hypothetical protein n=1 Tax=Bartonella bovis TaxID=155194 RepID=UPI000C9B7B7C|nr:hypothetical protein [Bartonella bovis]
MTKQRSIAQTFVDVIETTDEGMPPVLQGRDIHTQQVSFFRSHIQASDPGLTTSVGVLPRGAFIKSITVYTLTDFEGATATIGKKPGGSDYGTQVLGEEGVKELELPLKARSVPLQFENTIYVTRDKKSSKGDAEIIVEFYTNR